MARGDSGGDNSKLFTLILVVVTVATLYLAKEVLIPLALAALLAFVLTPLVNLLERWHLGRVPSILLTVGAVFAALVAIGWVVAGQMVNLADDLPKYQENISARIHSIKRSDTGPLSKIESMVKSLTHEFSQAGTAADKMGEAATKAESAPPAETDGKTGPKPIPVEIIERTPTPLSLVSGILPGAFGWLGTLGIVVVFLIFMLLEREDMRNRLISLTGPGQITTATQALDDAGRRVSKYLRMQLIINATYGLCVWIGLSLIGLPNAALWGFFAGVMRYVPYVGPWLGASIGILLSLAVFDGWTEPLLTVALFVLLELIVNNVMEPVLYNSSTGISTMGVLVSAVFWTWLWGAVGLVLSMPLTVCIVVLGRYVPQLDFLNTMLSNEQVLPPGAHLYQRLLVGDDDESRRVVEDYLKKHGLEELLENVLLPAVVQAKQDAHRGILDDTRRDYIFDNIHDLLDELPEMVSEPLVEPIAPVAGERPIAIVPARDAADELAGALVQLYLQARGIPSELLSSKVLFSEIVESLQQSRTSFVVISAVPPFAVRHTRQFCKRLKSRAPETALVAGVWSEQAEDHRVDHRLRTAGADKIVGTLQHAVEYLERRRPTAPTEPAPMQNAS